ASGSIGCHTQAATPESEYLVSLNGPTLQPFQPRLGVAKLLQFYPKTIHERQIQAAHLTVVLARLQIVQRTSGFERASESAGEHQRQSEVVVLAANPEIGKEHQAGIIKDRAVSFLHAVQLRCQVSILAHMETGDPFVSVGVVVMRRGMVPFL